MIPLPAWLTGIGVKAAAIGLAILAFLAMILRIEKKGEAAGAAKVEAKTAQATAANVAKAQQAEAKVAAQTDAAVIKEAEDKWTR
jgi:hypothetical protein